MGIFDVFVAVIWGIVEGITEWLPVSSTGHMILVEEFLKFQDEQFSQMFLVVVQLGAILAVVLLFWSRIWPFRFTKRERGESIIDWKIMQMWFKILLIIVENWNKGRKPAITSVTEIGYDTALIIGIFQLLAAVVPGTSRSGATIIGALLLGVARGAAAEFTFYLAIPVMFGASVLKIIKSGLSFGAMGYVTLLVGMLVAFVVSLFVIRYLMSYIRKHDFKAFGYYRIVLGVVVLVYFFLFK